MLKHLLISIIAVAFAFLWAGVAANLFKFSRLNGGGKECDKETGYRFFLGCGLILASGAAAVYSAIGGYFIISAFSFTIVCVGALLTVFCLKRTNGGDRTVEPMPKNDGSLRFDYRHKISETEEISATADGEKHIISRIRRGVAQYPRRRAIACSIIFAVFLVIFSLFVSGLDVESETVDGTVVFETVEQAKDAIFLTAKGGAETYAIFGYALQNDLFEKLSGAVDGERTFAVRYTVMDRDQWSGYYRLLSIRDGDGVSYLEETDVTQSRADAVAEKATVFGILALLCGGACGYYTALAIKEVRNENLKNERKNER